MGGIYERSLMAQKGLLLMHKSLWVLKPRDAKQDLCSGENMVWLISKLCFSVWKGWVRI